MLALALALASGVESRRNEGKGMDVGTMVEIRVGVVDRM